MMPEAKRARIHNMLERMNRILIIQGTWTLKMIEIPDDFIVPCHALDIVAVLEKVEK